MSIYGGETLKGPQIKIYGGDNLESLRMKIHGGEPEMPIDVRSMAVNLKCPKMSDLWWWKLIKTHRRKSMVVNLKCP